MIRRLLKRVRRRLTRKPYLKDPKLVGYWFDRVLGAGDRYVVQIGSNDGKTGDPIWPLFQKYPGWRGLLVEPIPYLYRQLVANHPEGERYALRDVAVGEEGLLPFYHVDPAARRDRPDLPVWYEQLGSFDRGHIERETRGEVEAYIRRIDVRSTTLPRLLEEVGVERIDLFHVDAEGYDWEVLRQLDLKKYSPTFILLEYHHLSEETQEDVLRFLGDYHVFQFGIDWLAVHPRAGSSILASIHPHRTCVRASNATS